MADIVFNIAKGRISEYFDRVDNNDPAAGVITLVPVSVAGTVANVGHMDSLDLVLAVTTERVSSGWARVELTDTQLETTNYDPNDTDDRMDVSIPEVSLGSPTADAIVGILVCYDAATGGGTDADIIPLTHHDLAVTGDSSEVIINTGDLVQIS